MGSIKLKHQSGAELDAVVTNSGLVIGRSHRTADLTCSWDSKMSRRHGRVWLEDGFIWYEDLGSSNGSWHQEERLESNLPRKLDTDILLGETTLSLVTLEIRDETTLIDGMTIQLGQPVSRQDFAGALHTHESGETLAEFVDKLLGAAHLTEIAPCLRTLYEHLPPARHIFLIDAPEDEEDIRHLLDPKLLQRDPDEPPGSVSRSLAKQAIERGEALLFSESEAHDEQIQMSAKLKGIRSAAYIPLLSQDGSPLGVLCVDSPQSTLPLHEQNLQLLRSAGALLSARLDGERLRQAAQEKELEAREIAAGKEAMSNFLKIASHDLKNPLTVVRMCGVLIERFSEQPKVLDLCSRLLDAGRRAEQLITSYLEVTKLESGQALKPTLETVSLRKVVEEEFLFLQSVYERRDDSVDLRNEVPELQIQADQHKLEQILSNLVGNAIKYGGENPQVIVAARMKGQDVVVSIQDQGRGITPEDQEKLFSQFQRVGQTGQVPGTGLGLWLSYALVKAHGGDMWVESEPGKGSTFYFSLPQGQEM